MMPSPLILIDDDIGHFGPMTDVRPIFDVRTGAMTPRKRIETVLQQPASALICPSRLAAITTEIEQGVSPAPVAEPDPSSHAGALVNPRDTQLDHAWFVNARAADAVLSRALPDLHAGEAFVDDKDQLLAARGRVAFDRAGKPHIDVAKRRLLESGRLMTRSWDVIAALETNLAYDLSLMSIPVWDQRSPSVVVQGHMPVHVAPNAKLHAMVVLNCERGPIVIDRQAIVGSFSVLAGPCYIGPHSIIAPHTHVRAHTAIGPRCVVGGEVSQLIMQGHANKSHAGFLGHSYVGQWANFGADTTGSNLKNTYGLVRMQTDIDKPAEDTGLTKLGAIVGDYVRTAIGSRLITGSCFGLGAMIACEGFAPKCIPPLTFITPQSSEPYDIDRFLDTARLAMSRRDLTMSETLEARLRKIHAERG